MLTMPIPEYLHEILDDVRDTTSGELADYIPELKSADPNPLAVALCTVNGHIYSAGDDDIEFTMQSISKPFAYALALQECGFESELAGADRNLSIAHMLRNYGVIEDEAHDAVLSYTLQCAIKVTTRDLAVMTATLAAGGTHPITGKKLLDARVCRLTLSVMASAGMYDEAGQWLSTVGIPAKSGVAGGLIGILPGQLGIATFSPRLNPKGNSVRGVKIFKQLSDDMGLHLMSTEQVSGHAVRSITRDGDTTFIQMQGAMNFSASESFLHAIVEHNFEGTEVVLDLTRVLSFHPVAIRMIKEGLKRIRDAGFEVFILDPDDVLPDFMFSDGTICKERV